MLSVLRGALRSTDSSVPDMPERALSDEQRAVAELQKRQRLSPKIYDATYLHTRVCRRGIDQVAELLRRRTAAGEWAGGVVPVVLDVGCGFRPWESVFDGVPARTVGVDFSTDYALPHALGVADRLPFRDSSVDAIILSEVLEHVPDLPAAVREVRRVVKPGGLLFISTPFLYREHGQPYDFQRPTRYFYRHHFAEDEIVMLEASNTALAAPALAVNVVLQAWSRPLIPGLKEFLIVLHNLAAIAGDAFARGVLRRIRQWVYDCFPLGYTVVIRVQKGE